MILVDSSVWIAAARKENSEFLQLTHMIKTHADLCYAEPIRVEVSQGARTEHQFLRLWDSFLGFTRIEITSEVWHRTARNYFRLRTRGLTVGTMDVLIATLACENALQLWSCDQHFSMMAPLLGLDLFSL